MKITLVLLSILMLLTFPVKGQSVDLADVIVAPKNISASMQVFEDPNGSMNIQEVHQQKFETHGKSNFIFPFTSSAFWIKVELTNKSSENEKWVLSWENPLIEELVFYEYIQQSGEVENVQVSNLADDKNYILYSKEPAFTFNLSKGEQKTIYLRLESKRGHFGTLHLYSEAGFYTNRFDDFGTQSFLSGLLIFRLLLIVVISFFVINDKMFRAYSGIVLFKTLGFWAIGNISGPIFSSDPLVIQKINHVLYILMPFSLLLFALKTLPMQQISHWVNKFGYFLLTLAVCMTLAVLIDYEWYWIKTGMSLTLSGGLFTLSLYVYFAFKKQNIHKYYAVPLLLGLVSNMLIMSRLILHIDFNGIYALAMFMFVSEILTFIIFLGQIFKQVERKKLKAEQGLLLETDQNRKLKELDKLKTSFFTNISHELRTPLTLMHGPSQELVKKYPGERLMGLLSNNLSKLRNLVDELLDIQKLEVNKIAPEVSKADISAHLRLLVYSFTSLAESKEIELQLKQSHDDFSGYYDTKMFVKVINNLLSNALKFTPKGGAVDVKVSYSNNPNSILISVCNSGSWIGPEDLPHVFERFYQASHAPHEGTGIGLALVKELVSVLKGTVTAESDKEIGTTFNVSLPLNYEQWKEYIIEEKEEVQFELEPSDDRLLKAGLKEEEQENSEAKELLLVVEDNAEMREYIKILLAAEYDILEAENGAEGLLKAKKEIPDLIICDAMMPVMNGYEFSKNVKSTFETSHVPIVMLTAKASKESKIESYSLGVDNYLTKPFDTDELKSVLSTLRENRKRLQQIYTKEVVDLKPDEILVSSKEKQFLDMLKGYLEENFAKSELTVSDIAAFLKMSDTQLRRKLKSTSAYSPNEYLRKFRLEKAAQLLGSNAKSVSEVAYEVGYENLSYFSKIFQNEYNCLPSDYTSVTK